MNNQPLCFHRRLLRGRLLLGSRLFLLVLLMSALLLSACGHAPQRPAQLEPQPEPPTVAPSAALDSASGSAPDAVSGANAYWPYGQSGDTLAAFPPLSAAERLSLTNEQHPGDLYTYVLYGAGDGRNPQHTRPWRHTEFELLRLIDTYVIDTDGTAGAGQRSARHEFLVPVYAGLASLPLAERSAPVLADAARQALAARLEAQSQGALASRLREAPGPFLVSRTSFDLLPSQEDPALLLADLSAIGPEYLYPVVDAYDRPVSAVATGTDAALFELRQRLWHLDSPAGSSSGNQWVFLLEPAAAQPAVEVRATHGS
ncbi:hypothetical protein [Rhabdochromatium marinum]|uniref:hypothetical protein n=1 Tax=Rhabdochromatium marinum TaxID=48729 RepID=UPI001902DC2A|nr:hypothetical protein [Rhabdochromatium marinum]MBK1647559.1 hypothetical protein [Rhabdochromatium marinum]